MHAGNSYVLGPYPTSAYSSGTSHWPPGAGFGKFYNGTTWKTTAKNGSVIGCGDGYWSVYTTGDLNLA